MVKVVNLARKFAGITAVDNISFTVPRGQVTGFLGPNGAGKTTTLRILSGYLAPSRGYVEIDGLELGEHSLEIRRHIGYLPENVPLYPEMRVREYLKFRAQLKGMRRGQIEDRLDAVRVTCGLDTVFDRIIGRLSRGHWQRIGLADSLIHEPELLILDEPTMGLDPNQIRLMRDLIRGLGRRYTVILSTHFLSEAAMICDRILILNQGRLIASDTPDNLTGAAAGHVRLIVETNSPPEASSPVFSQIPGVRQVIGRPMDDATAGKPGWYNYLLDCESLTDLRPAVFNTVRENGWVLRELRRDRKNLEDIFATLTAEN